MRLRFVEKLSLCVSHRPKLIVTTRAPASTSRRAMRKWSMQHGGPSFSLVMSPMPYRARTRGSSLVTSSASYTRREVSTSNARWVKLSMPRTASSWSKARRKPSSWPSSERRLGQPGRVDGRLVQAEPGPAGAVAAAPLRLGAERRERGMRQAQVAGLAGIPPPRLARPRREPHEGRHVRMHRTLQMRDHRPRGWAGRPAPC